MYLTKKNNFQVVLHILGLNWLWKILNMFFTENIRKRPTLSTNSKQAVYLTLFQLSYNGNLKHDSIKITANKLNIDFEH